VLANPAQADDIAYDDDIMQNMNPRSGLFEKTLYELCLKKVLRFFLFSFFMFLAFSFLFCSIL